MTKNEFLNYLENRLSVLNKKEREDIEQEYSQHIENKLSEGMTETEAVASLGDIDTFVDEILMAYNIDPNYRNTDEQNNILSPKRSVRQKLSSAFVSFFKMKNVIWLAKTSLYVIAAIALFAIGLDFAIEISEVIDENLPSFLCIDHIVSLFFLVSYILIYVTAAISIGYGVIRYNLPVSGIKSIFKRERGENMANEKNNTMGLIIKVLIFLIKLYIIFTIMIPYAFVLMVSLVAMGALVVALLAGYPVVGLSIGCFGFNIFSIAMFAIILKLIFIKKKGENEIETYYE